MRIFFAILISLLSVVTNFPINYDEIIFPDDNKIDDLMKKVELKNFDSKILLDDPNLLKSANTSEKFFHDKEANSKLEHGNHFQGDILLHDNQKMLLNKTFSDDHVEIGTRTGLIWEGYRWPKNEFGRVVIPYVMSDEFTYDDKVRIVLGMNDLQKYTCVQFVKRTYEDDYIYIHSGNGCYSNLGKIGGMQHISLQRNGCLSRGIVIHELIHALGYDHMQNHPERDNYVYILWENIYENQKYNFRKDDPRIFSNFGTPYDYYSVMHYELDAFSKNGKATIIPKDARYSVVIGQRNGLSGGDAKRINNIILTELPTYPINDDRIIFPDEFDLDENAEKAGELKVDQRSLFNDPKILKIENLTEEFLELKIASFLNSVFESLVLELL